MEMPDRTSLILFCYHASVYTAGLCLVVTCFPISTCVHFYSALLFPFFFYRFQEN